MTGSVALDIVIGLVFIYLLYSLLATIIQEAIANMLRFRAKFLEKAVARMLEDGKSSLKPGRWNNLITFFSIFPKVKNKLPLLHSFYSHPLIKYLAEDNNNTKPSYLTAQNFSKTLIDLLRGNDFEAGQDPKPLIENALKTGRIQWKTIKENGVNEEEKLPAINEETLAYLRSIWADSQGDVDKFRVLIEQWFDITMERTTGWYKKHIQKVLLVIGFVIAVVFNVDTIKIKDTLANNPELRNQLVTQADNYIKTHQDELAKLKASPSATNDTLEAIKHKADSLMDAATNLIRNDIGNVNNTLGLGWTCHCKSLKGCDKCGEVKSCINKKNRNHTSSFCFGSNFTGSSLIGWFITALAISLGAPFWFDMLNKLMKLRGAVNSGDKEKEARAANPQSGPASQAGIKG